jgi:hypothetical protein
MSDTAFQIQYRQEFIEGFEQHKSLLAQVCTNEAVIKGNQAVFLVADSGPNATAVTRGVNGLIPARADDLNQFTATLAEWHDLVRKTSFNVFASQGDQRRIMQMTSLGVINRKIDNDIITTLDANVTQHAGAASTATLNLVMRAKTILGNQAVPLGNNIFAVVTPAFEAYLMQIKEFGSVQYVDNKPVDDPIGIDYDDRPSVFKWAGVTWIVHPNLTGVGTAAENCYMFHRSAIGHAVDTKGLQSLVGYFEEQDYSWARTTIFMGTQMLQTRGVVQMIHDGSAFVAT